MCEASFNITLPTFDLLLGSLYWQPIAQFEASLKDTINKDAGNK